jgi:elongation factor 3
LTKSGASKDGVPPPQRNLAQEASYVSTALLTLLPSDLVVVSASLPNGPHTPRHPLLADIIACVSSLVADLIFWRRFSDVNQWRRCVGVYFTPWFPGGADEASSFAEQARLHFAAVDKVRAFR